MATRLIENYVNQLLYEMLHEDIDWAPGFGPGGLEPLPGDHRPQASDQLGRAGREITVDRLVLRIIQLLIQTPEHPQQDQHGPQRHFPKDGHRMATHQTQTTPAKI